MYDNDSDQHSVPKFITQDRLVTETIDLESLVEQDARLTGSFRLVEIHRTAFGKLLQALPLPAMLVDAACQVVLANDACEKISPSYANILHKPYAQLFPLAADAARAQTLVKDVLALRKRRVMDGLLQIGKNKIWARTNLRSVRIGDEQALLILVEDLTAEKKQLSLNEKYRRLVDIFPIGIAEFSVANPLSYHAPDEQKTNDITNAKVTDGNNEFAQLHGYGAIEEVKGLRLGDLLPLTDDNRKLFGEWFDEGFQILSGESEEPYRPGETRYLENTLIGTVKNGALVSFWVLRRDVTDRKKSEKELLRSNELQRKLLATAATGIFTVNPDKVITAINDAFSFITGFDRDEVVGVSCESFTLEPCSTSCGIFDSPPMEKVFRKQCTVRARDGRILTVLKNANLLRDEQGHITGAIESFVDVTELIEAQMAAEAANQAKSNFLATMSHEIRTPLNGIIANMELALSTELTPEQQEYLTSVRASADSLLTLISDILDYSTIEAGKLHLQPRGFSLRETVGSIMRIMAAQAHTKGLEISYRIPPEVPDSLLGDAQRLKQVLINLVGNSVKFTDEGEIVLLARTGAVTEESIQLHFTVRDTGIGIPSEMQGKIFEAFKQVDGSMSRKHGGSGLGLAIAAQLAEKMRGELSVESEVGRGSTFHFTATLGLQGDGLHGTVPAEVLKLEGTRILVVDDNATNRTIVAEILARYGMKPTTSSNAPDASAELAKKAQDENPYHLAIIDAHMPCTDGFELARQIKVDDDLDVPIIMMLTKTDATAHAARWTESGIREFITKPVQESELIGVILRTLYPSSRAIAGRATKPPVGIELAEKPLHILLAEDNLVNQKVAVRMLEKRGHTVSVASNGAEALAVLGEEPFDLILMDIQMPGMDGITTTRIIRENERTAGGHIPIVAMTAYAMREDRERCLAAGMDGYLAKPVHPAEVFALVEKLAAGFPE